MFKRIHEVWMPKTLQKMFDFWIFCLWNFDIFDKLYFFRRNEKILRDKLIIGHSQVFSIRPFMYLILRLHSITGQIGLKRISARYSQFHGRPLYIFQAEKYFFGSFTEPIAHTGSGNKNPHKSPFDSKWARKYFTCFIIHPPCNFCNAWSSSSSLKTCGKFASELRG